MLMTASLCKSQPVGDQAEHVRRRWALTHQVMLSDRRRLEIFDQAIKQLMRPGYVVADVGTGTGILALLAARAGALRVYAIDHDALSIEAARTIFGQNEEGAVIELIHASARDVKLPEQCDLIISETIGNIGGDEGIADSLAPFSKCNLRRGGRIIPERVETYLVPVEMSSEGVGVWSSRFLGFDMSPGLRLMGDPLPSWHFLVERPHELGRPVKIAEYNFRSEGERRKACNEVQLRICEAGRLHAFITYFVAHIGAQKLSNYPCYPGSNWCVWSWPIRNPIVVNPGDSIHACLEYNVDTLKPPLTIEWELKCQAA
jgi:SAM-dependent methyltransferase